MLSLKNLISKGLFPETLPPCFDSSDLIRGLKGINFKLQEKELHRNRSTSYIRYTGTKHDGNRRLYATPNPINYYSVCRFVSANSKSMFRQMSKSQLSISSPRAGKPHEDRAIIVSSLSDLSKNLSKNIRYSPFILKTDVSQFFPSIYTHAIPWVAHGREKAKADRSPLSKAVKFNRLDWFCQQCQSGQTRGVTIGADAFRFIAEFIASEIDKQLSERAGPLIIGGVRHVDDFYIGVGSEIDATVVLSHLRDILQEFELQINDNKTQIISGLVPIDDTWAQRLRASQLSFPIHSNITQTLDDAFEISNQIKSQSPMRLVLRRLDQEKCYKNQSIWADIEPRLQRIMYHFSHCVDYICLLLVKRFAIDEPINRQSWHGCLELLLNKHTNTSHHHEICWILWTALICKIQLGDDTFSQIAKIQNSHVSSLLLSGYAAGLINRKPPINFSNKLGSTDEDWLHNLVARATGLTRASFGGALKDEFEHLASRKTNLLDFDKHIQSVSSANREAISRSKYGYEGDDDDSDNDNDATEFYDPFFDDVDDI